MPKMSLRIVLLTPPVFAPYRSSKHSLVPQMFVFLGCQALCIALGLYKCWSMGLLPTESSDWLAWRKAPWVRTCCFFSVRILTTTAY